MYEELFSALKKPALWQRSSVPFWDDEHISKGMLDAHLDPNREAASRTGDMIDRSVKWLSTVIPSGSRILDLGCGPGLYTSRLTARGYDVTGVDISRRSIEYARAHDAGTEYICGDYLSLELPRMLDAVTLIYCDYAALTLPERRLLLTKVRNALRPGGLFILDVFTPAFFAKKDLSASWVLCENGGFYNPLPHLCFETSHIYEGGTVECRQCVVITADGLKEYLIWDTVFTTETLSAELVGFAVQGAYSNVCGAELTGGSDTLCVTAVRI